VYHAISLWQHHSVLANCSFAAVFPTPKHTGLRHLGRIAGKKQCYGTPKNGLSEANLLGNCGLPKKGDGAAKLPRFANVIAVGGIYKNYFPSYCRYPSFKTIFWALNY
jgi:hypothetical protein